MVNKDLDALLCLLDGKITAYRMKQRYIGHKLHADNIAYMKLVSMQEEIQKMWDINNRV